MGMENNECVIVNVFSKETFESLKHWITKFPIEDQKLFAFTTGIGNMCYTVFLAPSGSKVGWDDYKRIAHIREEFICEVKRTLYSRWVEVGFGEFGQKVLRGNNVNCYSDEEYHGR